ncbi:MAG: hypothetical protein V3W41_01445 [Planctomycetota bacterium]
MKALALALALTGALALTTIVGATTAPSTQAKENTTYRRLS